MASEGRRWHLIERLGAGAFGEVYLAEQDSGAGFRRRVALKVLHPQVAAIAEAGRRMRDEARILGRLSHRNIVTVLDLVRLGDQWAVVMDYIPGADLDRVLETLEKTKEIFPAPAAFEVGAAVAEAIDAAFTTDDGKGGTLGVVHRDIKPSNVLITRDGDVKVLDFGVARVNNMDTRESRTGLRVGTERYMSPQRICGEEDDLAGDVYALGASIAELVLGKPLGRTPVDDVKHGVFLESNLAEVRPFLHGPADVVDAAIDLLRSMLDADVAKRPPPRVAADQFTLLGKQMEGATLAAFARAIVPTVDAVLGNTREPVSGVLSERSFDRSGGPTLQPATSGGSPDAANATVAVEGTEPIRVSAPSRVPPIAVLGAAAVVVVLLVFGGVATLAIGYSALFSEEPAPEAATAAIEAPVEAPAAVPDPVPTEVPDPAPAAVPDLPVAAIPAPDAPPVVPKARTPKAATPVVEAVVVAPVADAPRVSRALVVMQDASALEVRCGEVTARGTASVRITSFPAGDCVVRATVLGRELSTTVAVDRPREVACTAAGEVLSCP